MELGVPQLPAGVTDGMVQAAIAQEIMRLRVTLTSVAYLMVFFQIAQVAVMMYFVTEWRKINGISEGATGDQGLGTT